MYLSNTQLSVELIFFQIGTDKYYMAVTINLRPAMYVTYDQIHAHGNKHDMNV